MSTVPKVCVLVCLVATSTLKVAFAQSDADTTKRRSDVVRVADGVLHNISSPLRWKGKDWATVGIVILGDAAVSLADKPVNRFWQGKKDPTLDAINDFGDWYGQMQASIVVTGSFYLTGVIIKNQWARETGVMLGTAVITSGLIQEAFKPLVGRARPVAGEGHYSFHPFSGNDHYHSFPSGHSIMAFTASFVLARRVKSVPLKIFFYTLSSATAFCRLYSDAHWISDVAIGATAAWFSTNGTINHLSRKKHRKTSLAVIPGIGSVTLRLALR